LGHREDCWPNWGLAFWQTSVRRREQADLINQERKALLLLVKSEVLANTRRVEERVLVTQNLLEYYERLEAEPHSDLFDLEQKLERMTKSSRREAERAITTATWDSTKVRLAQLLHPHEIAALLIYYDELVTQIPHLPHIDFRDKAQLETFLPQLEQLQEISETVLGDLERMEDKYEFNQ
jgi:hypothetical protein